MIRISIIFKLNKSTKNDICVVYTKVTYAGYMSVRLWSCPISFSDLVIHQVSWWLFFSWPGEICLAHTMFLYGLRNAK